LKEFVLFGDRLRKNVTEKIFISGGTGYVGRAVTRKLLERGHSVLALARAGSESKVTAGAQLVTGNALKGQSFVNSLEPGMTSVHLTGTPHPAPWKEKEFRANDLASLRESAAAAQSVGVGHFVYKRRATRSGDAGIFESARGM